MSGSIIRKVTVSREKKFKVAIIGAKCVGKSALTVRIKTRKFIHNYAPNMESKCAFSTTVDGETVNMEVIDTAALQTAENVKLEERIKWADAFILLYSVTDQSSLEALLTAKFLLNLYAKRRRTNLSGRSVPDLVALVGNKCDLDHERMISEEQGRASAENNDCTHFFELSARESYDSVKAVFDSLYRSFLVKPVKHSSGTISRKSSYPITIPDEQAEQGRRHAAKRRERSATALNITCGGDITRSVSPKTFRRIVDDSSIRYSSSSKESRDDIHFVGEQILETSTGPISPSQKKLTIFDPPMRKLSKSKIKGRWARPATINSDYFRENAAQKDANNNG